MASSADLPSEILANIFLIAAGLPETRYEHPLLLRVSSVSRAWRNVALGSAEAWSKITLSPFRPIEIIKLYFDRAKAHPLELTLFHYSPAEDHGEDRNAFEEYALPAISRWRKLTIDTVNVIDVDEVISILKDARAPNLEVVDIKVRSPPVLKEFKTFLLGGVPALRTLSVYGLGGVFLPPLENLTTLEIDEFNPTHAELQTILSDSPSLRTLVLNRFRSDHGKASHEDALIEIPSLRAFALCYHPKAQHKRYAYECHCPQTFLIMPNLEYLELSGKNLTLLFSHFQSRTETPEFLHLRKLRFHDIELIGQDLQLLRVMPELEYLEFDKCKLPSDCDENVEDTEANVLAKFNPKLRTIVVSGLSREGQLWLQDYLKGRKVADRPIPDLYIKNCDECEPGEGEEEIALPWPRFNGSENEPGKKEYANILHTVYPFPAQRPFLMARSDEDFSADIEGENWRDSPDPNDWDALDEEDDEEEDDEGDGGDDGELDSIGEEGLDDGDDYDDDDDDDDDDDWEDEEEGLDQE